MKKTLSVITLAILLTVSFCACSEPAITISFETPMPTVVLVSSTDTPAAATTEPTASPTPAPLTVEEIELSLEALTGEELVYSEEIVSIYEDSYYFANESGDYIVASAEGVILTYGSYSDNATSEITLDEAEALIIAEDVISLYYPGYLDYEYELDTNTGVYNQYYFYFYQLSEKGRHTGNVIRILVRQDGSIESIIANCDKDPTAVDGEYSISEEEAVDVTYEAALEAAIEEFTSYGSTIVTDADQRENHTYNNYLSYHNDRIMWIITVENISASVTSSENNTVEYIFTLSAQIYADNGEVFVASFDVDECYTD